MKSCNQFVIWGQFFILSRRIFFIDHHKLETGYLTTYCFYRNALLYAVNFSEWVEHYLALEVCVFRKGIYYMFAKLQTCHTIVRLLCKMTLAFQGSHLGFWLLLYILLYFIKVFCYIVKLLTRKKSLEWWSTHKLRLVLNCKDKSYK